MARMPFGKYRGHQIEELPDDYLGWLLDEVDLKPRLLRAVREEVRRREGSPAEEKPPCDVEKVVGDWFRRLALKYHPDRGGSEHAMRAVNDAHDLLRQLLGLGGATR